MSADDSINRISRTVTNNQFARQQPSKNTEAQKLTPRQTDTKNSQNTPNYFKVKPTTVHVAPVHIRTDDTSTPSNQI